MYPRGIIYRSQANKKYGEFRLHLTDSEKKAFKRKRLLGAVLASFSITTLIFFYGPSFFLDFDFLQSKLNNSTNVTYAESNVVLASDEVEQKDIVNEDIKVESFDMEIPALSATSNIVYNVNPFEKEEYLSALQKGIAHASTSGLPGQGRRIYLFAHSTNSPLNLMQFNAVFYQLRLLTPGDKIILNLNGEEHIYQVNQKHVVGADDTKWLTETQNKEELILQTCDPPGTTLRRLLIVAEPI